MTKSPVFFETGKPILQEHKTASFIFFKVIFFYQKNIKIIIIRLESHKE